MGGAPYDGSRELGGIAVALLLDGLVRSMLRLGLYSRRDGMGADTRLIQFRANPIIPED